MLPVPQASPKKDIGIGLLALVLREAGVSRKEWERLQ